MEFLTDRLPNLDLAEKRASALLANLGIDEIFDMPVDPEFIAAHLGIAVHHLDFTKYGFNGKPFGDDRSGLLVRNTPVIYVNANHSETRQRFTLAHEVGHFLLHDDPTDIYWRDFNSAMGRDPKEMEANRFGASLLMPRGPFISVFNAFGVEKTASFFGVSLAAAKNRLNSIRSTP
ncbi:hypothetical protein D3C87_1313190 [compost metagenome]